MLRVNAAEFGPQLLEDLKPLFLTFPGKCEVQLEMRTRDGRAACVSAATTASLPRLRSARSSTSFSAPERSRLNQFRGRSV